MTREELKAKIQLAISELTNASAASLWQRMSDAFFDVVNSVLSEISNSLIVIKTTIANNRFGKPQSYVDAAYYYQQGDELLFDSNFVPYYAVIDDSKHLIAAAAFEQINNVANISGAYIIIPTITLKVAKLDGTELAPLTPAELTAFDGFLDNYRIAGVYLPVVSLEADIFRMNGVLVTYDTSYNLTTIKTGIETALTEYRKQKRYNSTLYINEVSSYVKSNVPGVIDFFISDAYLVSGDSSILINGSIQLPAGYFNYFDNFDTFVYVSAN